MTELEIDLRSITVNPTETEVVKFACHPHNRVIIIIKNNDGLQTLNVYVQRGGKNTGPWNTAQFDAFLDIQPGETRFESIDISGYPYLRLYGLASGAGLSAGYGWRKS